MPRVDTLRCVGLRKLQRNELFNAIEERGFSPGDFHLDHGADEARLSHLQSGAYFVIGGSDEPYTTRSLVGDEPVEEFKRVDWDQVVTFVQAWIWAVKDDIETPDLWAELRRDSALLGVGSDEAIENTPFTPDEQAEIAAQLRELREYVTSTYTLSEAQMRLLDAKLEYLVEAAGRLGRIDWRSVFAGVMITYIVEAALPQEAARDILLRLLRSIAPLFGLPELPSPG